MNKETIKILGRTGILAVVLSLAIVAFNLRGNTPGITFATQGIDLKIDSRAYYNGSLIPGLTWTLKDLIPTADHFFSFSDIKPGDSGRTIVSTHVSKSPAFLCLDFTNLISKDNGVNEPESHVDINGTSTGELAQGTKFFAWLDNGDGVYKPGEKLLFGGTPQPASVVLDNKSYVIGDSKSGGECKVNDTRYVGIAWCAGAMSVNQKTGVMTCNGSALGNEAQTDSFSVDVGIRAAPSKESPQFLCGSVITPPKDDKGKNDNHQDNNHSGYPGNIKH